MKFKSGVKWTELNTPVRRRTVKQVVYQRYRSVASTLIKNNAALESMLMGLGRKIRAERRKLCSLDHNSVLRNTSEAVKHFSWEVVLEELQSNMPTLVKFLKRVFPQCSSSILCMVVSQLLKFVSPKMALVQRAISVLLYGNGASKQVSINLSFIV